MTHIRLSHPWKWHHVGDVLEVGVDVTAAEAHHLIRAAIARDVADVITPLGNGWYAVPVSDRNTANVRGYEAAVDALRAEAGQ